MDVKSGYPWWTVRDGLVREYPPLRQDVDCEVAVVGAGITGALIARALTEAGVDTLMLDRGDAAWGSTSASTALLQYEIDTELVDLAGMIGESEALHAYRACERAVRELGGIAAEAGGVGYRRCDSLYFASSPRHVERLRAEYAARNTNGFDVQWLEDAALCERFGFAAPAALLSRPAARVNPYLLAHALLARACERGMRLFDRTGVESIHGEPSHLLLRTGRGPTVRARRVVIAAGYETERFLPVKVARNRSSYALVSETLDPFPDSFRDCVAWETARPYLYWRAGDNRLIIGGEDDAIDNALKRDLKVSVKSSKLIERMKTLFPQLELQIGFAWAGTFAETKDGLPWFGAHPKCDQRILFAMAYGGNGITYSAIGAHILRQEILGGRHELAQLFGFERISR